MPLIDGLFVCLFVLLVYNGSAMVSRTGRTTGISLMRILVALAAYRTAASSKLLSTPPALNPPYFSFYVFPSDGIYPCSLSGDLAWVAKQL